MRLALRPARGLWLPLAIVLLAPLPGIAQNFGGQPVAERYFRVEVESGRAPSGGTLVWGHVHNGYVRGARNVRLLVEGLDGAGRPVGRTIGYVNGEIPADGRRYFQVAAPATGATFRVSVLDFEWVGGGFTQ
jgi:hypothetical protein